jgi:hypothetical protein
MTAGVKTLTTLSGTEMVIVDNGGAVIAQAPASLFVSQAQQFQSSFTTSAMSNSTSITLSAVFTALTYTQTSTGNIVHLKAAPAANEVQGFSVNAIVTNLTVSSAANTVSGGAIGAAALGQSFNYTFNSANTTWYPS